MRKVKTDEERIATKLANLISDLRLDLEQIGIYFHRDNPNVTVNRLLLLADIVKDEKEIKNDTDYL